MARKRSTFGRVFRRRKPDGTIAPGFYVRARIHGREITRWAGPDRKTANEFAAELLRRSAREDLLGERAIASVTFAEIQKTLLGYFEARHGATTARVDKGRLARVVTHFGTRPIREITAGDVADFLTGLKSERANRPQGKEPPPASAASRNRYASLLSVAFRFAVEKGYARANPVKGLPRSREAKRAVPFLAATDVDRIVATAPDARLACLLRVLADTGLRRSEVGRLEWRDVDLVRGVLVVRQSKSGRPREVPLTGPAHRAFAALHEQRGAVPLAGPYFVWPEIDAKGLDSVTAAFKRLRTRAGFPSLRLHDLRHGFCSRLAQAGVPMPTIAALAGHESIVTTMRYASHLPDGATADAIRRLDAPANGSVSASKGDTKGDTTAPTDAKRESAAG